MYDAELPPIHRSAELASHSTRFHDVDAAPSLRVVPVFSIELRGSSLRYAKISLFSVASCTLWLSGCVGPMPEINVTRPFAGVSNDADGVDYRQTGEAVDVGEPSPDLLTKSDAIRRAISHDPGIQAAIARVRQAQADAKQSRLLPNPVLSVVFRFPESGGDVTVEAGLTAELVSLLGRPGRVAATDDRLRATSASAVSVVLDVIAEVKQKYVAVQSLSSAQIALQERMGIVTRLLELARSRLRAGEGSRLDVVTLETQQVELESDIAERELELREERLALARLVGEPSSEANWRLEALGFAQLQSRPERDWIADALANRPEIQVQRFELGALGADLSNVRFAPFDGAEGAIESERDGGEWSVGPGLSLPLPLFDFGQARRDKARSALEEGLHNLTRLQRQVVEETRRAYAGFTSSQENVQRIQNRLIPLAQQRLEQAESQFKAGQVDVTGLLLAEQDLRAARIRLVELQRRNAEALIRLERASAGVGKAPTTQPTTAAASR